MSDIGGSNVKIWSNVRRVNSMQLNEWSANISFSMLKIVMPKLNIKIDEREQKKPKSPKCFEKRKKKITRNITC